MRSRSPRGTKKPGPLPIAGGGTGSSTAAAARDALNVYSKAETYGTTQADALFAPAAHVGAGGAAHALAVAGGDAGFFSGADQQTFNELAARNRSARVLVTESQALGTTQPLSLADATMVGLVAGGSVSGDGTVGVVAASFASLFAETSTAAGQAALGEAAAADRPYPVADFPGQRGIAVTIRGADGDEILLAQMLSTAAAADQAAQVYGYLSYRSDLVANLKWRLWFYYRRNADGLEVSFTPDIAVNSAKIFVPEVFTPQTAPVGAGLGIPVAGQAAAGVQPGVVGDVQTIGTAAAAGASGRFADAQHAHPHGAQTDGSLHAAAVAGGAAGFLTDADKQKLDDTNYTKSATVTTNDATVTTCGIFTPTDERAYTIQARVAAFKSDGTQAAGYLLMAAVRRTGGVTTLIGAAMQAFVVEDDAAWDAVIDVSSPTVRVRVTGKAATTIKWSTNLVAAVAGA